MNRVTIHSLGVCLSSFRDQSVVPCPVLTVASLRVSVRVKDEAFDAIWCDWRLARCKRCRVIHRALMTLVGFDLLP